MEANPSSSREMNIDYSSSSAQAISAITSVFAPTTTPSDPSATAKQKLKRNRIVLSCQACHKRKQQCDRGNPCQRCVKRGTQHECFYEQPKRQTSTRPKNGEADLSEQVSQLETLVQSTLGNMEPAALAGLDALLQLVQASNAIASPAHLSGPATADPARVTDHAVQVAAAALGQLSQQGVSVGPPPAPNYSPISEILNHIRGAGNSQTPLVPASLADLRTHFPNHAITTFLLQHFFDSSSLHWMFAIVHRPLFDSCYHAFSSGPHPPSIDFVALLAIVCASALQFLPESDQDSTLFVEYEPGRHVLRKRLYDFARSVLVNGEPAPYPTVERIQALAILAVYQVNDGNIIEFYNALGSAIHMAQSLAMNRDGAAWSMKPLEAELRRRLWWTLFTLDRSQCIILRRPYFIFDQHCDAAMPLNLDQFDLRDVQDIVGKPTKQPTENTFHLLQIRWAQLIGEMWDQCFSIRVPTYRAILDIEGKIRRFELDMPASFRSQSMQGALARPYLLFQNQFLTLQIYHIRALLVRPYLFIRPEKEVRSEQERKLAAFHRHAKNVCLTFCKRLLALLQLIQSQVHRSQLRWCSLALCAFDPALMLAVAIIMDPIDSQNEELSEWIAQAQHLLQTLGTYNTIAPNAAEQLAVIRKRTQVALHPSQNAPETPGSAPSDVSGSAPICSPFAVNTSLQYIERSTRTLAQPQPSISDLLGPKEAADSLWNHVDGSVFSGNFPGIESLCGHTSPETLENFLDSCASR